MQNKPVLTWDMESLAWQDRANCKGLPVDTFYYTAQDMTRRERNRKERTALRICANCDVNKSVYRTL